MVDVGPTMTETMSSMGNGALPTMNNRSLSTMDNRGLDTVDNRGLDTVDNRVLATMDNRPLATMEEEIDGNEEEIMTCPAARLEEHRSSFCNNNQLEEFPSEYPDETDSTLLPCTICNRTFNPQALDRHRKVCERLSSKRRQTFNSTKQRVDGLDLAPTLPRGKSPDGKEQKAKSKSKWREKHQEFLRAIRAAKGVPESGDGGDGPPVSNIPSDYVQCPHCERHFGPKAADRHIDWCKEKATRMPRSPANTQAVQRLKTRTKYVPPKPGQNGWRAPKKSDVISSIPPPSSGPTPTPMGALGAREFSPPTNRHLSPTRSLARQTSPPLPTGRHLSPPPMTSSRRTSISSVSSLGRSGSMSLGRSAGKQLSAMLRSVTGQSSNYGSSAGYGASSGYGQSSRYGQSSGYGQQHSSGYGCGSGGGGGGGLSRMQVGRSSFSGGVPPMVRQGSMRSSLRRTASSTPMARHRDLASDMMASVCITPNPKRGEPEGDEAGETSTACSSSLEATYSKLEDAPYDPFSAAELQMQALMGPAKPSSRKGSGLGAAGLGLGMSMMDSKRMEVTGRESPDFDFDIGLEEFEKEYRSTKEYSPEYNSSKSRIRNSSYTGGVGLGKRSGSVGGLDLEPTIGSPTPRRSLEKGWPWKINPNTPSGRWSVGTASPTFKKRSWGSPRDTVRNNQNLLSSVSQENLARDISRWSPTRDSSQDSRNWSSALQDTNWSALTRDIHSWSSSATKNNHNSTSNSNTRNLSSSSSHDNRSKSSPSRDIRCDSPARSVRSWTSPTRDTHRWSSPSQDSHSETSPLRELPKDSLSHELHRWSSPVRENRSPSRDSIRSSSIDSQTRASPTRETRTESPSRENHRWSSPSRAKYTESSHNLVSKRWSSPSRDKENLFKDEHRESSPLHDTNRWSTKSSKSQKDSLFGRDARSWSSPPRERLNDSLTTDNSQPDLLESKRDSSPLREIQSWKSLFDNKKNDSSSFSRDIGDESSSLSKRSIPDARRSISPIRDSSDWPASGQDSSLTNTSSNSESRGHDGSQTSALTGWSGGESSSGISSFNKYFGGSSTSTQRSTSLLTSSDGGYSSNHGFGTYRTSQDAVDSSEMRSVKKGAISADDSQARVSSGSSSDSSSLPPLSSPTSSTSPAGNNNNGESGSMTSSMKMPRFCHECGHKYPVLMAKFCCHCGSRRASVEH